MNARCSLLSMLVLLGLGLVSAPGASAAVPQPCGGVPQISDPNGDGHHSSSDVLAAWFSEEAGRLQAVIQVRAGTWEPEHDDAEINGSGFALIFTAGGKTSYVRARDWPNGGKPVSFDYGSFAAGSWFTSLGESSGEAVKAAFGGTVTIDVPANTGAVAGAVLGGPYVLTYDGITGGQPDWVDKAPGGTAPGDTARGADFRVGSCSGTAGGVSAVHLAAPRKITGAHAVRVRGRVVPASAGVPVTLSVQGATGRTIRLKTQADGTFSRRIRIGETTRLRATAEGIGSQTITVEMRSKVRIRALQTRAGGTRIRGTIQPSLPGRLLLLGAFEAEPRAIVRARARRFEFSFGPGRLAPGRYEVVYVPARGRAERSTSNGVRVPVGSQIPSRGGMR